MKVKFFNNTHHEFMLSESLNIGLYPKLCLFPSPDLILSSKGVQCCLDAYNTYDYYGFLYSYENDCTYDIMLFDQNTINNLFLHVMIPCNLTSYNISLNSCEGTYRIMPIEVFKEFDHKFVQYANYNEQSDDFTLSYIDIQKLHGCTLKKIAQNLSLILLDDLIVGWNLSNSSHHIYDGNRNKHEPKDNTQYVLAEFWKLYIENNFEKMNYCDLNVKKDLERVLDLAHKDSFYPVIEIVEDWIDMNY